jgi:two-component system CheB/CheR fusion protein
VPINKKHRTYTRRATVAPLQATRNMPRLGGWNKAADVHQAVGVTPASYGALHQKVVEQLAPPSALVNDEFDIVHLSEHVPRFLRFAGGEPSRNLLKVVHPGMRLDLQAILLTVKARMNETQTAAESRRVQVEIDGKPCVVNLTVRRVVDGPAAAHGFFLVTFDETSPAAAGTPQRPDGTGLEVAAQLQEELQRTHDQLNVTVEQYETTTEELKASNEELQAINEELRSTTEELETSKEELQSLNEELTTVNQELREKIEELGRVNSDLQNLLSSTDIGTIFLDRGLQIKRYTERVKELFNIIQADIGRPLDHLTHKLDYQALTDDAVAVLKTLQSREREVRAHNGRWYLARLLPYRTLDDKIDGVVLNFVDITDHRHAEELRQQTAALQEQSQILGLGNVFIRGLDDRIMVWNTGCERLFGYTREEPLGRIFYELLRTEFPRPLAELKAHLLSTGSWEGELEQVTRGGGRVSVGSRWVLYRNEAGEPSAILEVNHDLTARKLAEEELRQSDRRKDQFLATLPMSCAIRSP